MQTLVPEETGRIVEELMARANQPSGEDLVQFRSRVGAHQYARLYDMVQRYVPPNGHVLDWGAGNGHFSYFALRRGLQVTAYSLQQGRLNWLADSGITTTLGSSDDPVRIPFASESFDAVTSVGVLEHVQEVGGSEVASLKELFRVLKPGGVFLCYHLPNKLSAIEAVARCVPGKHSHRYRFTDDDIRRLMLEAGFSLLEMTRYALLPRNFWQYAPRSLRDSKRLAHGWDWLDDAAGQRAAPLCQNYAFVARRSP